MGSFHKDAERKLTMMQTRLEEIDNLYAQLEAYFVFDREKYPLEEFMSDLKTFKDQFKVTPYVLFSMNQLAFLP